MAISRREELVSAEMARFDAGRERFAFGIALKTTITILLFGYSFDYNVRKRPLLCSTGLIAALGLVFAVVFQVNMFLTDQHVGHELMESFKHHDLLGSFNRNMQFQNNTSRRLGRMEANNHESEDHLLTRAMDLKKHYEGLIKFLGVVEGPLEEVQEDTQDGG